MKWRETGEDCIMGSFITFALHQILLGLSNQDEMDGACNMHDIDDVLTKFWSENLKVRDHSQDLGVDGKIL
jgi:hypothetical protein